MNIKTRFIFNINLSVEKKTVIIKNIIIYLSFQYKIEN